MNTTPAPAPHERRMSFVFDVPARAREISPILSFSRPCEARDYVLAASFEGLEDREGAPGFESYVWSPGLRTNYRYTRGAGEESGSEEFPLIRVGEAYAGDDAPKGPRRLRIDLIAWKADAPNPSEAVDSLVLRWLSPWGALSILPVASAIDDSPAAGPGAGIDPALPGLIASEGDSLS